MLQIILPFFAAKIGGICCIIKRKLVKITAWCAYEVDSSFVFSWKPSATKQHECFCPPLNFQYLVKTKYFITIPFMFSFYAVKSRKSRIVSVTTLSCHKAYNCWNKVTIYFIKGHFCAEKWYFSNFIFEITCTTMPSNPSFEHCSMPNSITAAL